MQQSNRTGGVKRVGEVGPGATRRRLVCAGGALAGFTQRINFQPTLDAIKPVEGRA